MSSLVSAVRKSFRVPKIEEQVKMFKEAEEGSEKKRNALWSIRDLAEKQKNPQELVRLGVIPIMVHALKEGGRDERLWSLWVLRFLADNETSATLILQEPEAIEGFVRLAGHLQNPGC